MLLCFIGIDPNVLATDLSTYESLQELCLAEKKDTPENCECGQETADKVMTPQEQVMALALMQGVSKPAFETTEQHDEFMKKLFQITKGYTKPATP